MHKIEKIEKYVLVSNGIGLIHRVHNTITNTTTTGQPFMVFGDSEEELNDLWYSTWEYKIDSIDESKELIGTAYPVTWITGHATEKAAQDTLDLVMTVLPIAEMSPVKHPERDEWANPYQEKIFNSMTDENIKSLVVGFIDSNEDNIRTKAQMIDEGWFN